MQPNVPQQNENEIKYSTELYTKGILPGPGVCVCQSKIFTIQWDNSNKTSKCCFLYKNQKCWRKFSIRIKSLYNEFPFHKLKDKTKLLNCFLCLEFNWEKAYKYLKDSKVINISKHSILKIFKKLRDIIYKYMYLVYETELIREINKNEFYAADKSLICHNNNKQICLLVVINNTTKVFRIVGSYKRDSITLGAFIKKYLKTGNNIITYSWPGYNWIDSPYSDYQHIKFNHGLRAFGTGIQYTSHIEDIWNIIKSKIKNTYYIIPWKKYY